MKKNEEKNNRTNDGMMLLSTEFDSEGEFNKKRKRMPIIPNLSHHFNEPEFILRLPSYDDGNKSSDEEIILVDTPLNVKKKNSYPILCSFDDDHDEFRKMPPKLSMKSLSLLKINSLQHRSDPSLSLQRKSEPVKKNRTSENNTMREGEMMANVTKMTQALSMTPVNNRKNSLFQAFIPSSSPSPTTPFSMFSFIKSIHNVKLLSPIITKKKSLSPTISSTNSKDQSMCITTEFVYETPIKRNVVCGRSSGIKNTNSYGNNSDRLKKILKSSSPPRLLKKILLI